MGITSGWLLILFVLPVCAEAYNPDDDKEEGEETRVVHPKTDEQRRRLQDVCRDILLFKTLEQVQQPLVETLCGLDGPLMSVVCLLGAVLRGFGCDV